MKLYIDLETFSELDIKKVGGYKYARNCEPLIVAYAWGDDPVEIIDLARIGYLDGLADMPDGRQASEIIAHNSAFDRQVLQHQLHWKPPMKLWRDTMVMALGKSLPAGLGDLCAALGLDADQSKDKDGRKLINRFCKPAPSNHLADRYGHWTHHVEWDRFVEYARQDVASMRECDRRMRG